MARAGFRSRTNEIYELLARAGENAHELAQTVELRFRDYPSGPTQEVVKELEHEGDRIISELLTTANAQFVTPIDRDDLITLAFAVDDVADSIENAAELLGLYRVELPTRQSLELCALLVRATEQLAALLRRLKGLHGSADEILTIKAIEDEADHVARAARAGLFKDDRIDPTMVIRWKDIYEALERALDSAEHAANVVANVLVKNA
jgi:predicted phosphate transport protein (TIGR00153 family)